jgi:tetratricopeptide (TPR) repeat protein
MEKIGVTVGGGQNQGVFGAGSVVIENFTINNQAAQDPAILQMLVTTFTNELRSTQAQRAAAEAKATEIATELKFTTAAVIGFFLTLGQQSVPPEQLPQKLAQIANQFETTRARLAALEPADPITEKLLAQAKAALENGQLDEAEEALQRAEEADLAAAGQARELAHLATVATDRRLLSAAEARSGRGELSLTRLEYRAAAAHFQVAAALVPAGHPEEKRRVLNRHAVALYRQGNERGDNAALEAAIEIHRLLLKDFTRERMPLNWAGMQTNLGTVLRTLGEREAGTARLEKAVLAFHAALEECTRERDALAWALIQGSLGEALQALGGREAGTARLEEAVAAYRLALEERTRERVPLDWAATLGGLGSTLLVLGERGGGHGAAGGGGGGL